MSEGREKGARHEWNLAEENPPTPHVDVLCWWSDQPGFGYDGTMGVGCLYIDNHGISEWVIPHPDGSLTFEPPSHWCHLPETPCS